ncbi:MAG: response regulator transcription factor [Dehalococcoidia bacterium]
MKKILVVDDEKKIVDIVKAYLEREGYQVAAAYDGESALNLIAREIPDMVILDLMLPGVSGWDVCRRLRGQSDVPIIMLTARDEVSDRIVGLELGADDYVPKPFDPKELVSRVRALFRRTGGKMTPGAVLSTGDLVIDSGKRTVQRSGNYLDLTATEFELLKVLAENPGRVYTRMQLLDLIQGDSFEGYERTVDSHVKNLRKKIVYGVGYKLGEQ